MTTTTKRNDYGKIWLFNKKRKFQGQLLECLHSKQSADEFKETVVMLNRLADSQFHCRLKVRTRNFCLDEFRRKGENVFLPMTEDAARLSENAKSIKIDATMAVRLKIAINAFTNVLLDDANSNDFYFLASLAVIELYRRGNSKSLLKDSVCHIESAFENAKKMIFAELKEDRANDRYFESITDENLKECYHLMLSITLEMLVIIFNRQNYLKAVRPTDLLYLV